MKSPEWKYFRETGLLIEANSGSNTDSTVKLKLHLKFKFKNLLNTFKRSDIKFNKNTLYLYVPSGHGISWGVPAGQ